jgi:beta-phosphoglucomutase-like phosphatase (HAD superfamily)
MRGEGWVIKAILWDMDGVLADTGEAHFQAWKALMASQGRELSREAFNDTFGMANPAIMARWFGDDLSPEAGAALVAEKERQFRAMIPQYVPLGPGVRRWLAWGRVVGCRQVVASSGEMDNIVAVLTYHEVGNYFDAIVSGNCLPQSKPDPTVFLYAAAGVGAAPRDCLVIEDGVVGVEAARRAGMRCLAVTSTHRAERLAGADQIVARLDELPDDALARLLG